MYPRGISSAKKGIVWYSAAASLVFIACLAIVNTAWISDDAAITLRSVLNLTHGYGPNFNINERVQSYTHPLWFLLISSVSLFSDNIIAITYLISICISLGVFLILITRTSPTIWSGISATFLLVLSKAYLDFSTSGLENPLSHLLIVISIFSGLAFFNSKKPSCGLISLLVGTSLYLSRPDLILLIAPWCGWIIYQGHKDAYPVSRWLAIASTPPATWTLFSVLYYGYPFPNTAYAKINTGIPLIERIFYGLRYVLDSLIHDPITVFTIITAFFCSIFAKCESKVLSLGMLFYLLYIISIGGDFMSGRFLSPIFLIAVIVVIFLSVPRFFIIAFIFLSMIGLTHIKQTLLSNSTYTSVEGLSKWGVADERGFYYQKYGLLPTLKNNTPINVSTWQNDRHIEDVVFAGGGLGFAALAAGPSTYFIDLYGLADPLLSHLPPIEKHIWRPGHFSRQAPLYYEESIKTNHNILIDPELHAYYEKIRSVTRESLFNQGRLKNIFSLNFSKSPSFDRYAHLSGNLTLTNIKKFNELPHAILDSGTPINQKNILLFYDVLVLEIQLPNITQLNKLDLSLDNGNDFLIEYFNGSSFVKLIDLHIPNDYGSTFSYDDFMDFDISHLKNKTLVRHVVSFKNQEIKTNRIRITATNGDGLYALGHFQVQ